MNTKYRVPSTNSRRPYNSKGYRVILPTLMDPKVNHKFQYTRKIYNINQFMRLCCPISYHYFC